MDPRYKDGVVHRQAHVADYEGVIGCNPSPYGGADYTYLPWYYRVGCHTKGHYLFVAEEKGAFVSWLSYI